MLAGESLTAARVAGERDALLAEAGRALDGEPVRSRVRHELRYRGQSFELSVEQSGSADPAVLREAFARAHELRYGYRDEQAEVELVNIRVSVWGPSPVLEALAGTSAAATAGTHPIVFDGEPLQAVVHRGELPGGTRLSGPALCALGEATLLVPPGWAGEVDPHGTLHLRRLTQAEGGAAERA
jgi:N-methylhydantoinase A